MKDPVVGSWGAHWQAVSPADPLQRELAAETADPHPLGRLELQAVGRCRTCDDVAAVPTAGLAFPEIFIVHLTWQGRPELRDGHHWPYHERLEPSDGRGADEGPSYQSRIRPGADPLR